MKRVNFTIANAIGENVLMESLYKSMPPFWNVFQLVTEIINISSLTVNFRRWYTSYGYRFCYFVYKIRPCN